MVTGGHNLGRVGTITSRERHPGSFDIVHVKDSQGHSFATRYLALLYKLQILYLTRVDELKLCALLPFHKVSFTKLCQFSIVKVATTKFCIVKSLVKTCTCMVCVSDNKQEIVIYFLAHNTPFQLYI